MTKNGWEAKLALLFIAVLFLIVPQLQQPDIDRGFKTQEEYWADTGLTSAELESLLSDSSCYSSEKSFLSCVNAISNIAEKFDLALTEQGQFISISAQNIQNRLNEKRELSLWKEHFAQKPLSFLKLWKTLEKKIANPIDRASVVAMGVNGFLSVSKDPHSYIIPLAFYEEVVARSESRQNQLGFIARRVDAGAFVRKVFDGSPAATAGLRKGDWILKVNGEDIKGLTSSQFNEKLKIKDGQRLSLWIERRTIAGVKEKKKFIEIYKGDFLYPSVTAKFLNTNNSVGLLTLHKFGKGTCGLASAEIKKMKALKLRGLILDLRDNPGGQVEEAACVINLFVEKDRLLFETRYLESNRPGERYLSERDPVYNGPLVILINGGSASSSEIVAGALRDMGRATLIGERTFGKGTFQDGHIWNANSKVAIFETEGMYYFPSGWTPQLVGLEPDVPVSFGAYQTPREEDLFFNPIVPRDIWTGPQALAWSNQTHCVDQNRQSELMNGEVEVYDPQIKGARGFLECKVGGYVRNESL